MMRCGCSNIPFSEARRSQTSEYCQFTVAFVVMSIVQSFFAYHTCFVPGIRSLNFSTHSGINVFFFCAGTYGHVCSPCEWHKSNRNSFSVLLWLGDWFPCITCADIVDCLYLSSLTPTSSMAPTLWGLTMQPCSTKRKYWLQKIVDEFAICWVSVEMLSKCSGWFPQEFHTISFWVIWLCMQELSSRRLCHRSSKVRFCGTLSVGLIHQMDSEVLVRRTRADYATISSIMICQIAIGTYLMSA